MKDVRNKVILQEREVEKIGIVDDLKTRDPEMKEGENHLQRSQEQLAMAAALLAVVVDHPEMTEEMMIRSIPIPMRPLKKKVKKMNIGQGILWLPHGHLQEVHHLAEPGLAEEMDLAEPGLHRQRLQR